MYLTTDGEIVTKVLQIIGIRDPACLETGAQTILPAMTVRYASCCTVIVSLFVVPQAFGFNLTGKALAHVTKLVLQLPPAITEVSWR